MDSAPELLEFAVCSEEFSGLDLSDKFIVVPQKQFNKLSATVNSQGIIAIARKPEMTEDIAPVDSFVVVLDKVGDPGNFGTILRTAKAVGLKDIWFTSGSVDPFNDKVIRSALSAQFSMRLREFDCLSSVSTALRASGFGKIYRTDPHEGGNCFVEPGLFERSAIVFGSESSGAGAIEGSTPLTIPMPGNFESINVAQAATVILFEYVRRLDA